jgi:hypothetical protein
MKNCFTPYRKGLYDKLGALTYNGVALNAHQFPPKVAAKPYIFIGDMNSVAGDEDADVYTQDLTVEIHSVTEYFGDQGSAIPADEIMDIVMQELLSKGVTQAERDKAIEMDDFWATPGIFVSLRQELDFDEVNRNIRTVLTFTTKIDQK